MNAIVQYFVYLAVLIALAIPLGIYMSKVMNGEKTRIGRIFAPLEKGIYKIAHLNVAKEMTAKAYIIAALVFNAAGLLLLFVLLLCQGFLPLNPQHIPGMSPDLAFNTAVSFMTNTNWQAYSGEAALSYLSQMLGLGVQNFVSAATGLAVLFAVIRGFTGIGRKGIGNFFRDLTRSVVYVLLPLAVVETVLLMASGVPQSFRSYGEVNLLEPYAVDATGEILEDAVIDETSGTVTVDGAVVENASILSKQVLPLGPAASQIAIKQLGTNGGGFYGVNSAHPLENPSIFTNLLEMLSLLLLPVALCFSFGREVKDKRQGKAIFAAMLIMLVAAMAVCHWNEAGATPQLSQNGAVAVESTDNTASGNMEGKETRFGIPTSVTWATWTTAASNGSVNSMHDSYTPIGGLVPMLLMMLGEVVFGGVGCGLYGMLGFVILTVFIAGLMVGRTPEYLGKKIEPYEMKMAVMCCLATPLAILLGSGLAALLPSTLDSLNNPGAHGLSEILYTYASTGGNNGSAFAGFGADTPFINISTGLVMLFVRVVPLITMLLIAGSMVKKKKIAVTAGTLPTSNAMFVFLLVFIVALVGALSFFPALSLGPVAEFFQSIG